MKAKLFKDIAIVGDIHGDFAKLDEVAEICEPDIIIQVGDFGIWHNHDEVAVKTDIPIYFVRGNHENHDVLDAEFGDRDIHLLRDSKLFPNARNIHICNHGSILEINDFKIMFIGGARSIDKHLRTNGVSWWSQEILTPKQEQYVHARLTSENPDVIVSHTCPSSLVDKIFGGQFFYQPDPVGKFLDYVVADRGSNLCAWFFGHFHENAEYIHTEKSSNQKDIIFTCIEDSRRPGYFITRYI